MYQIRPKIIILLAAIAATGFPFQILHRTVQPYSVNLLAIVVVVLVHLPLVRKGLRVKKNWGWIIASIIIIAFSITRGFFLYPAGFRVEDGWLFLIGLYLLLDNSPFKNLLWATIIITGPIAVVSLYGGWLPAGAIVLLTIAAFIFTIIPSSFIPLSSTPIKPPLNYLIMVIFTGLFFFISLHALVFDPGFEKNGRVLFDVAHGTAQEPQWNYSTDLNASADAGHGKLVDFLTAYNYKVKTISAPLKKDILTGSDILLIVMSNLPYTREEIRAIKEFVNNGGGLMVIGDHTNVDDAMASMNPLLEEFRIRLNFDVVWVDRNIKGNLLTTSCPVLQNVDQLWLGNGASLSIFWPAKPFLMARYGSFSDMGNMKTGSDGGYLGNSTLDKNEKVGELILGAWGKYGKGRVIVFGDSSYFQNLTLYRNYQLAYNSFNWLNRKNSLFSYLWLLFSGLFFLAAVILLVVFKTKTIRIIGYALVTAIIVAQCFAFIFNNGFYKPVDYNKLGPRVLFDFAHFPEHKTYWEDKEQYDTLIDSLVHQTLRVGLHPLLKYRGKLSNKELKKYDVMTIVAPNKTYSRQEIKAVTDWVYNGGGLLVAEGPRKGAVVAPLLEPFGITLDNKPLGIYYCEKDEYGNKIRVPMNFITPNFAPGELTRNVKQIQFMNPVWVKGGKPLAYIYDYPVMATVEYGAGKVLVIGDDLVFSNFISEGEKGIIDLDKVTLNWNIMKYLAGVKN